MDIQRCSCDDSICENWKLVDSNTHKSALSARVAYPQDNLQEQLIQSNALQCKTRQGIIIDGHTWLTIIAM